MADALPLVLVLLPLTLDGHWSLECGLHFPFMELVTYPLLLK